MDWAWHLIGGLGTAGAIVLILWALFWDRARGRLRCSKCWYDMSASTGLTCPECGRDIPHAKRLTKTRRRWRWGAAGVFAFTASLAIALFPHVRGDQWVRYAPTSVLILGVSQAEDPVGPLIGEITARGFEHDAFGDIKPRCNLSARQQRALAAECARVLDRPGINLLDYRVLEWLFAMGPNAAPAAESVVAEYVSIPSSGYNPRRYLCERVMRRCAPAGAEAAVPELTRMCREARFGGNHVEQLGWYGPAAGEAVPVLHELLGGVTERYPVEDARLDAVWTLGKIGHAAKPTVDDILALYDRQTDPPPPLRGEFLEALGAIDPTHPRVASLLTDAVFEAEASVRCPAGQAISASPALTDEAIARCRRELDPNDTSSVLICLRALASIGPAASGAADIVASVSTSDHPTVQMYATRLSAEFHTRETAP